MAQNKNALIRYRIIDKCLQNRFRKWTLQDLIIACSEALYEYEGKAVNVSKRTLQLDIQMMRSDKLGYNAPIIVYERKYYKYENPNYSITDIPLNQFDMEILSESMEILKQFQDFSLFNELGGIIHKLEDRIYTNKSNRPAIIHLDKNENLKGLAHLDILYKAIQKQIVLTIKYQSFKAKTAANLTFHPFILKEFNNRWFLIGQKNKQKAILTLALDRVTSIDFDLSIPYNDNNFDAEEYYKNTYGVTVLNNANVEEIELLIYAYNAPYVLTKPFHRSQKLLETYEDGSIRIQLRLHHNFELERLILGFGNGLKVLQPKRLQEKIKWKLKKSLENYNT